MIGLSRRGHLQSSFCVHCPLDLDLALSGTSGFIFSAILFLEGRERGSVDVIACGLPVSAAQPLCLVKVGIPFKIVQSFFRGHSIMHMSALLR